MKMRDRFFFPDSISINPSPIVIQHFKNCLQLKSYRKLFVEQTNYEKLLHLSKFLIQHRGRKLKIRALIEFLVFDLDVELGIWINVEVFHNLTVRQIISYIICVKIVLCQIGFYL